MNIKLEYPLSDIKVWLAVKLFKPWLICSQHVTLSSLITLRRKKHTQIILSHLLKNTGFIIEEEDTTKYALINCR